MLPVLHWPSTSKGYQLEIPIGYGTFGVVYSAIVLTGSHTNEKIAIKVVNLDQFPDDSLDEIKREIKIPRLCSHPNVINYHTSFISGKQLWMVMPLLDAGSAANILHHKYPSGIQDEIALASVLKEVLEALAYFHANNQIHRDVKAANILLSREGKVMLADYGVCAKLRGGMLAKTFTGSPCWMAPEVVESEFRGGYDFKVDIWSFGITAIELAKGLPPYAKHPAMKVMLMVLNNDPPFLNRDDPFSHSFKDMVNSCLQKDPELRPSAEQLLRNKFFHKAKGEKYIRDHILANMQPLQAQFVGQKFQPKVEESFSTFFQSSDAWDFNVSGEANNSTQNDDPFNVIDTDEYGGDPLDSIKNDDT